MDLSPKISVIIPLYNAETYIGRCVQGLFGQTLNDIELIFVDDGSTDGSVSVISNTLEEYPLRKPQTMILRHPRNLGVAAARTTGMKAMTGEYMAHCDADDIPCPGMYRTLYEAAMAADADMVSCTYTEEPGDRHPSGTAFSGNGLEALRASGFTFGLWDKIIRSSIIRDNGIYPYEGIDYNEDLNVVVRALCHCRRMVGIKASLYHHTVKRDGSITAGDYKELLLRHSVPCMRMLDEFLRLHALTTGDLRYSSKLTDPIKFWMKSALFNPADIDLWCSLWPECRRSIPRIRGLGVKERMLMTLFARSPKVLRRLLKLWGSKKVD